MKKQKLIDVNMQDNILSLMGFGTFMVENPEVIINALKTGYHHLDLAEKNYSNSPMIKTTLVNAFCYGGLGLSRMRLVNNESSEVE